MVPRDGFKSLKVTGFKFQIREPLALFGPTSKVKMLAQGQRVTLQSSSSHHSTAIQMVVGRTSTSTHLIHPGYQGSTYYFLGLHPFLPYTRTHHGSLRNNKPRKTSLYHPLLIQLASLDLRWSGLGRRKSCLCDYKGSKTLM